MTERGDEQLMTAYGRGDFAAFEELYQRHREPLYRYILRLVGEDAAANDLFQQTWEKVIKAASGYRASTPFKAWLFVIARNGAMDQFRAQARRQETATSRDHATETAGPEDHAATVQQAANLADAISQLPPDQRDTLLLRLSAGLKLESIGQVTGVSTEAAKSRLRYAVRKLKQSLGEPDEH